MFAQRSATEDKLCFQRAACASPQKIGSVSLWLTVCFARFARFEDGMARQEKPPQARSSTLLLLRNTPTCPVRPISSLPGQRREARADGASRASSAHIAMPGVASSAAARVPRLGPSRRRMPCAVSRWMCDKRCSRQSQTSGLSSALGTNSGEVTATGSTQSWSPSPGRPFP